MTSKQNLSLFLLIALSILSVAGLIALVVLTTDGTLKIAGVALGAGYGLWLTLGFLIGRAIYGGENRRNLVGLLIFLCGALAVGIVYYIGWQLPYMRAHADAPGLTLVEQMAGILWVLSFAGIYLSCQDYRSANGS